MDEERGRTDERTLIMRELELYRKAPPPHFMEEAVERRKEKLLARLAELDGVKP